MTMKTLLERWKKSITEASEEIGIEDIEGISDSPPEGSRILRRDVIDFLVDAYAKNPSGPVQLAVKYANFESFYDKRMHDAAASYDAKYRALFLNSDIKDFDPRDWIMVTLHEIFHYNQHMLWNKDMNYRKRIVGSSKLPPGFTKDNLNKLDFVTLSLFWNKEYPSENDDPMEIDAWNQTDKNINTAMQKALRYVKSIKRKR